MGDNSELYRVDSKATRELVTFSGHASEAFLSKEKNPNSAFHMNHQHPTRVALSEL